MFYNQSGRSMVEMLGVLAIIGVLSVGAISGYSRAMEKYRWNQFIYGLAQITEHSIEICPNTKFEKININKQLNALLKNILPTGFYFGGNEQLEYTHNQNFKFSYSWYWCVDNVPLIEFFGSSENFCKKILAYNWFADGASKVSIVREGYTFQYPPTIAEIYDACDNVSDAWISIYF